MRSEPDFKINPVFGPAFPEWDWVPAPRYLLRRAVILDYLSKMTPGRLLEIGAGSGALLLELARAGWKCTGVETSDAAFHLAEQILREQSSIQLIRALPPEGTFDCVLALEVLEHIENDRAAVGEWVKQLRPGGKLFISVPADPRKFNVRDEQVGHYRRYERRELEEIIRQNGCDVENVVCYGWPLANAVESIRIIYELLCGWNSRHQARIERTHFSGIDRKTERRFYKIYSSTLGEVIFRSAIQIQKNFFSRDWGNGYIAAAVKRT